MCHLGDVAVHNRINEDNRPEEINFLWKDVFKKTVGGDKDAKVGNQFDQGERECLSCFCRDDE